MVIVPLCALAVLHIKECRFEQRQVKALWNPFFLLFPPVHNDVCLAPAVTKVGLISKSLNLGYCAEKRPADTRHEIKSFTVESKEFSASLHKHEHSRDGGGLYGMCVT